MTRFLASLASIVTLLFVVSAQAEPPSAANRALAAETLRRLADRYVPGKADDLVALLGIPGTGRVVSRGSAAVYLLFADPEGDQYIVEFQDASAATACSTAGATGSTTSDACLCNASFRPPCVTF